MKVLLAWLILLLIASFTVTAIGCSCSDEDDDDDDDNDDDDADDDAADDCDLDKKSQCENDAQTAFDACDDDCWENADCIWSCSNRCDADFYDYWYNCEIDAGCDSNERLPCYEDCWGNLADCMDATNCEDADGNCSEEYDNCYDICEAM